MGRPNPTQIGTLVWLASELMFFGGLFAMLFTLRSMAPETFSDGQSNFTHGFALLNTSILVFSSVTWKLTTCLKKSKELLPTSVYGK